MTPRRWPAVLVLAAAVSALVAFDQAAEPDETEPPATVVGAVVAADASPSATWFCAGGSLGNESLADHHVIIANATADPVPATLTVFATDVLEPEPPAVDPEGEIDTRLLTPAPEADPSDPVDFDIVVAGGSTRTIRLADLPGVAGDAAAAMVETWGGVVVEHQARGATGVATAPCGTSSATTWHSAGGTTRRGSREVIYLFNPFAVPAVVELRFATSVGSRSPSIYESLPVEARSVLPVDITDVVTLFDAVATSVEARSGRIVVDRVVAMEDVEGLSGLSLTPAAPGTAEQWILPAGHLAGENGDAYAIYNPTDREARVDLEIHRDGPDGLPIEPVSVTLTPGTVEIVVVGRTGLGYGGLRTTDATTRLTGPEDDAGMVPYWMAVRSLNGTGVVVERVSGARTVRWSGAGAEVSTRWLGSGQDVGGLAIVNLRSDSIVLVDVSARTEAGVQSVASIEIAAAGRQVIDLGAAALSEGTLIVEADDDAAIAVESIASDGVGSRLLVPAAEGIVPLELPLPFG